MSMQNNVDVDFYDEVLNILCHSLERNLHNAAVSEISKLFLCTIQQLAAFGTLIKLKNKQQAIEMSLVCAPYHTLLALRVLLECVRAVPNCVAMSSILKWIWSLCCDSDRVDESIAVPARTVLSHIINLTFSSSSPESVPDVRIHTTKHVDNALNRPNWIQCTIFFFQVVLDLKVSECTQKTNFLWVLRFCLEIILYVLYNDYINSMSFDHELVTLSQRMIQKLFMLRSELSHLNDVNKMILQVLFRFSLRSEFKNLQPVLLEFGFLRILRDRDMSMTQKETILQFFNEIWKDLGEQEDHRLSVQTKAELRLVELFRTCDCGMPESTLVSGFPLIKPLMSLFADYVTIECINSGIVSLFAFTFIYQIELGLSSASSSSASSVPLIQNLKKNLKFLDLVRFFNHDSRRLLSHIKEEYSELHNNPLLLARFLFFDCRLSSGSVSEYLSGSNSETSPAILAHYFSFFCFEADLLLSVRILLRHCELPSEGQRIERFLERFSHEWFVIQSRYCAAERTPPVYQNEDAVYIVTVALVMLNTDIHNTQVKQKMTCDQFKNSLRGINDGSDVDENILKSYYHSITVEPLARLAAPNRSPLQDHENCEGKTVRTKVSKLLKHTNDALSYLERNYRMIPCSATSPPSFPDIPKITHEMLRELLHHSCDTLSSALTKCFLTLIEEPDARFAEIDRVLHALRSLLIACLTVETDLDCIEKAMRASSCMMKKLVHSKRSTEEVIHYFSVGSSILHDVFHYLGTSSYYSWQPVLDSLIAFECVIYDYNLDHVQNLPGVISREVIRFDDLSGFHIRALLSSCAQALQNASDGHSALSGTRCVIAIIQRTLMTHMGMCIISSWGPVALALRNAFFKLSAGAQHSILDAFRCIIPLMMKNDELVACNFQAESFQSLFEVLMHQLEEESPSGLPYIWDVVTVIISECPPGAVWVPHGPKEIIRRCVAWSLGDETHFDHCLRFLSSMQRQLEPSHQEWFYYFLCPMICRYASLAVSHWHVSNLKKFAEVVQGCIMQPVYLSGDAVELINDSEFHKNTLVTLSQCTTHFSMQLIARLEIENIEDNELREVCSWIFQWTLRRDRYFEHKILKDSTINALCENPLSGLLLIRSILGKGMIVVSEVDHTEILLHDIMSILFHVLHTNRHEEVHKMETLMGHVRFVHLIESILTTMSNGFTRGNALFSVKEIIDLLYNSSQTKYYSKLLFNPIMQHENITQIYDLTHHHSTNTSHDIFVVLVLSTIRNVSHSASFFDRYRLCSYIIDFAEEILVREDSEQTEPMRPDFLQNFLLLWDMCGHIVFASSISESEQWTLILLFVQRLRSQFQLFCFSTRLKSAFKALEREIFVKLSDIILPFTQQESKRTLLMLEMSGFITLLHTYEARQVLVSVYRNSTLNHRKRVT